MPTFEAMTTAAAPVEDTGTAAATADDGVERPDTEGFT